MAQWIQNTNTHPNGIPKNNGIKLPSMDAEVWFSETGYAEVDDEVANILTTAISFVQTVSEPANPGDPVDPSWDDYYEPITIGGEDGFFDYVHSQSIDTERVSTTEKPFYDVTAWGAVGDGTTDDRQAIQDAADAAGDVGGTVLFPPGTYSIGVGGQTSDGVDYGLSLPGGVDYRLDEGATILASKIPMHLLYFDGANNWSLSGGIIDGAQHDPAQDKNNYTENRAHAIAVGYKTPIGTAPDLTTKCTDWQIRNTTITGAHRHGIEVAGGSERGWITDCEFTDAAGDDCISISGVSEWIYIDGCIYHNHVRDMGFRAGSVEIDDGPRYIFIANNISQSPQSYGYMLGKTHTGANRTSNHNYIHNCVCHDAGEGGFVVNPAISSGDTTSSIFIDNCTDISSQQSSFKCELGKPIDGLHITNCRSFGSASDAVQFTVGDVAKDVVVDVVVRYPGGNGVRVIPNDPAASVTDWEITADVKGAGNGVFIEGTAAQFADLNSVTNCDIKNSEFQDINFKNAPVRANWRTVNNDVDGNGGNDFSPEQLAVPHEGLWYLDDGTNTGSGTAGKRIYQGGVWADAWTL